MATDLFYEEQRFLRPWLWPLMIILIGVVWYIFLRQIFGGQTVSDQSTPDWIAWLIMIFIGIGLPALFVTLRMRVHVQHDRVVIRYRPIWTRTVMLQEVLRCEARTYRPILHYGGWGIRYSSRWKGWGYSVSGKEGVFLELKDGKTVMIGSQQAPQLAAAIQRAMSR